MQRSIIRSIRGTPTRYQPPLLSFALASLLLFIDVNSFAFTFVTIRKNNDCNHHRHSLISQASSSKIIRWKTPRLQLSSSTSQSARDLLYQDQQQAMLRRSMHEQELLNESKTTELLAPKLKATAASGTGFGGGGGGGGRDSKNTLLAKKQAKVVKQDGVLRINNVLSSDSADALLEYVLEQQGLASVATQADPSVSRSFYGVEQARAHRCDLQLSLLKGGYAADNNGYCAEPSASHVLADTLQELLGRDGTLRALYENLVTLQGEFYELAAVVTNPGSARQIIHPDLPHRQTAPLYVIFLALQDVVAEMGPTTFLIKTHLAKENAKFKDPAQKDDLLRKSDSRLSTLNKGDAVLFDARILHCGNANDPVEGKTRALFNFSFRNPKVTGSLGYDGSIRPGYCQAMTLGGMSDALESYTNGNLDPFAKYGSGLSA